jgi:hypothetical protein
MFALLKANVLAAVLGLAAAIFLIISVVQSVQLNGFLWIDGVRDKLEDCETNLNEARAERDSLIAAAKEAERLNKEQVSRIVNEQDRISKDVEADLTARLERLRRELRAKANNGNPQGTGASPDGKAPGTVVGEAGLCSSPEQLLRAAENEERHDQLITWVEQQLKVER